MRNPMQFVPYERLTMTTMLSYDDVLARLDNAIEPRRAIRFFESATKPYQGHREGGHFEMSRIIRYRNSFLPIIKGDIQPGIGGCSIQITMHPHVLVIAFMAVWLGGIGAAFILTLLAVLGVLASAQPADPLIALFPGAMLIFGYVLVLGAFKFESAKSTTFLLELFEGQIVRDSGRPLP